MSQSNGYSTVGVEFLSAPTNTTTVLLHGVLHPDLTSSAATRLLVQAGFTGMQAHDALHPTRSAGVAHGRNAFYRSRLVPFLVVE